MNIYQIAEKAGVSIATVSRVLNNSEAVSKKTREKVKKIIEEENYRPNILARGLTLDTIKIVGVICNDISDIFIAKALSVLQAFLYKRKYDTLLFCIGSNKETGLKHIRYLQDKHVDAIFLVGSAFSDSIDKKELQSVAKSTPIITVNAAVDIENVYSVYCDDEEGIREATEHLCRKGCKKILFLYDYMTQSTKRKIEGFKKALSENKITFEKTLLLDAGQTLESVENTVSDALKGGIPDAFVATSDLLALGAQKALQGKGIERSVIGFDNTYLCECATPKLSSVDPCIEEMCERAVLVLDMLLAKEKPDSKHICKPKLTIR